MKFFLNKIYSFYNYYINQNYLTRDEASNHAGISEEFLDKLAKYNVVKSVNNEGELFRKSDLDKWIKEYRIINPNYRVSIKQQRLILN